MQRDSKATVTDLVPPFLEKDRSTAGFTGQELAVQPNDYLNLSRCIPSTSNAMS